MSLSKTTHIFKHGMRVIIMEEKELPFRPNETPEILGTVLARGPLE